MTNNHKNNVVLYIAGLIPVIYVALLIAPNINNGLLTAVRGIVNRPDLIYNIEWSENSIKTILIFLSLYAFGIGMYETTKKNYRRREEHGSAKWGNAKVINKKYKQYPVSENKILTQNISIGLNGRKHRRNLNVLVCGGSGAGKTRFYRKT